MAKENKVSKERLNVGKLHCVYNQTHVNIIMNLMKQKESLESDLDLTLLDNKAVKIS